ncbi:uncharacterized protein LOC111346780 isoform X1 [Stylophora pistillata]|uniref:uncharacterized protein LOC111346780 isoform X1 n=1 Tax=Stylophora pistillata TaxID=50429 RepID=UPI000C054261|nr:uncharacterized protein LOC111346780 isoform X1 [Stylophora pistillata]
MAKGALNLTKATSGTHGADLMEALLLAFEEKMERKGLTSSQLSLSSTGSTASPDPSLVSTPSTTRFSFPLASSTPSLGISLPSSDAVSPVSPPHAEHTPQRMQITAPSAENDPIYMVYLFSEEALRTLYFFFCNTLSTACCYYGKLIDCDLLIFNRQSHVVSVTVSCVCGDSFKWLSSSIMGGSPPKYYVNLSLEKALLCNHCEKGLQ